MKRLILIFILGLMILSEQASSQTYVRVDDYRELRDQMRIEKEKVRNFILQNESDSIKKYFDVYYLVSGRAVSDAISFFSYREKTLINFFLDDSNQIFRDIDDDKHYFTYQYRVPASANVIIPDLTDIMSGFWVEFAQRKTDGSLAKNDKEEYLRLYLKRVINDLTGFPQIETFSQDSINASARNIIETMDAIDSRGKFLVNHILYELENSDFGVGFSFLPFGFRSFNTGLADVFENSYCFIMDMDFVYKRLTLNSSISISKSPLRKEVLLNDFLWSSDGSAYIMGISGSLGYMVLNTNRLKITPMVGVNHTRVTYSFADSTYSDNSEVFVQPHFGITMDAKFRIKSWRRDLFSSEGYHPRSDQDCLYIRFYAGHFPNGFSNAFGESGSVTHLSLGVGYYMGYTRLKRRL
jgi:hypothetical protein